MNVELFKPYPAQKAFIDKFVETQDLFGCLVAPRGSGKTLAAMNIALYWALSKKNQKLGWCAPTFSQSKNVLDQINQCVSRSPITHHALSIRCNSM